MPNGRHPASASRPASVIVSQITLIGSVAPDAARCSSPWRGASAAQLRRLLPRQKISPARRGASLERSPGYGRSILSLTFHSDAAHWPRRGGVGNLFATVAIVYMVARPRYFRGPYFISLSKCRASPGVSIRPTEWSGTRAASWASMGYPSTNCDAQNRANRDESTSRRRPEWMRPFAQRCLPAQCQAPPSAPRQPSQPQLPMS
jgi:hypothetical protein